ncbi:MAG: DUF4838 domain-containing protein [Lentisphaeria bacterium]|nr:DUF4838 domain-containing protein [Lentisphaeria bacterium]
MIKVPVLMTALLAAAGATAKAADLPPLFDNGKTAWEIRLPAQPTAPEQYAAEELQTTLRKISGAELPIALTDAIAPGPAIVIGTPQSSREIAQHAVTLRLDASASEAIAVKIMDDKLVLAGNQPRAALYAVYSFLREELACRWFWPGDDGEFLPAMTTWSVPANLDRDFTAVFRYREMTPCHLHYHVPTEIWMARNFLNRGSRTTDIRDRMGLVRGGGGHRVAVSQKLFETQPELFSIINGKHDPAGMAGCWANPDFTNFVVDNIVQYARDNNLEHLNVFPADIIPRCECDQCTANPDKSSRWFNYYAELITKIRQQLPEMSFGGIAYQEYRPVPDTPVRDLEYVQHCQYSRCYVHPFNHPDCNLNRKTLDELNRWREKAPMGIYGYEFDVFNVPMYLPFWNMLQDEIRLFRDLGIVYMKTELGVKYPPNAARADLKQQAHRVANYLYAQLIWNPDADTDALLADWCQHTYGPAAPHLLDYHRAMAAAWDAMTIHLTYFGAKPDGAAKALLNDDLVKQAKKLFADARKTLGEQPENSRWLAEVDLEVDLFDKWEKIYRVSKDNAVTACLPRLDGDNRFPEVARLPMRSKKGDHLPAVTRMYWNDEALHLQVDCLGLPDWTALPTEFDGHDRGSWGPESVEIFLTDHQVSPFWQIAANPTGIIYDAIGTDKSWDPALVAKPELIPDGWRLNLKIPFAALGSTPKPGDQWQIVVNRNSKPEASGFPTPLYHDVASGATIIFSANTDPNRRLAWISRSDLVNPRFNNLKSSLYDAGWQCQHAIGPDGARELDLGDAKLIFIETYKNNFPAEFYTGQLIPAIRNGAIALFVSYFWIDKLPQHFNDESFTVKFIEDALKTLKTTSVTRSSFATVPNDIWKTLKAAPTGLLEPAVPEAWEVLLSQHNSKREEKPYMIARPYGKGMVVISGDLRGNTKILENILEYNNAIRRPE